MANAANRIFKSADIGADHSKACYDDLALEVAMTWNICHPADKAQVIDFIASELFIAYGDAPVPDMPDDEVIACVTAEAEEIYQAWLNKVC